MRALVVATLCLISILYAASAGAEMLILNSAAALDANAPTLIVSRDSQYSSNIGEYFHLSASAMPAGRYRLEFSITDVAPDRISARQLRVISYEVSTDGALLTMDIDFTGYAGDPSQASGDIDFYFYKY